ncbi:MULTISPECIES: hypothetical protein [unclassified Ruegeria]|uniref:hypothetical protein n=1 Tax=unclassified Ruegeria TaxID=2625375 RepID=UPI00149294DE|nr:MULTISPECIES: hypothetical protein [unclassified Ruegeria]NOC83559.1 hypothetical protein [Ruegeria sp. HKCCD6428]
MFKRLVFAGAFLVLSGCAESIMQSYVGRDITDVILDYGQPDNVVKLPDGRFAFQWSNTTSYTAPTTTNVYGYGNSATAYTYGGGTTYSECLYTLFAKPNPQDSFTVIGYKKPTLMCA